MFKYKELKESLYFDDLSMACHRQVMNSNRDVSEIDDIYRNLSEDIRKQALLFIFEKSVNNLCRNLYHFVETKGFDKVPEVFNSSVAADIRDAYLRNWSNPKASPHWDLMAHESKALGSVFITDTINSVFDMGDVKNKSERLGFLVGRLELMMNMFGNQVVQHSTHGNQIVRHLAGAIEQLPKKYESNDWARIERILFKLQVTDEYYLLQLVRQGFKMGDFKATYESALAARLRGGQTHSNADLISVGLNQLPLLTIEALLKLDRQAFLQICYEESYSIFGRDWLSNREKDLSTNNDLRNVVRMFFYRISREPFLIRPALRNESLGLVSVMLAPHFSDIEDWNVDNIWIFSEQASRLNAVSKNNPENPLQPEFDHAYSVVRKRISEHFLEIFEKIDKENMPRRFRKAATQEEKIRFVCVRLLAENIACPEEEMIITKNVDCQHYAGFPILSLLCTKFTDQEKMEALEGFSSGIKGLIKEGLLDTKYMSALDLTDRGNILDDSLGF